MPNHRDIIARVAYCYRRAAVAWSVHPFGLLLQMHNSGMVGPFTRPIATEAQLWHCVTIHTVYCYWGCG